MTIHPPTPTARYAPLDQSPRQHARSTGFSLVPVVVLGLANTFLITSLYNTILLEDQWVSWTLATTTALGAAALAWLAGRSAAAAHHTREHAHTLTAALAAAAWAIVGAALFWLATTTDRPHLSAADTGTDQLLAVMLTTLYLMAGTLTATHTTTATATAQDQPA